MPLNRKCGSCRACCIGLEIHFDNEIKPLDSPCSQLCERGCSIYNERPAVCRDFKCMWIQDSNAKVFRYDARPDLIGVMFYGANTQFGFTVHAKEMESGAILKNEIQDLIKKFAQKFAVITIPMEGDRMILSDEPIIALKILHSAK